MRVLVVASVVGIGVAIGAACSQFTESDGDPAPDASADVTAGEDVVVDAVSDALPRVTPCDAAHDFCDDFDGTDAGFPGWVVFRGASRTSRVTEGASSPPFAVRMQGSMDELRADHPIMDHSLFAGAKTVECTVTIRVISLPSELGALPMAIVIDEMPSGGGTQGQVMTFVHANAFNLGWYRELTDGGAFFDDKYASIVLPHLTNPTRTKVRVDFDVQPPLASLYFDDMMVVQKALTGLRAVDVKQVSLRLTTTNGTYPDSGTPLDLRFDDAFCDWQ